MSSIVKVVLSLLVCILVNVPKSDLSKCTHTRTHTHTHTHTQIMHKSFLPNKLANFDIVDYLYYLVVISAF